MSLGFITESGVYAPIDSTSSSVSSMFRRRVPNGGACGSPTDVRGKAPPCHRPQRKFTRVIDAHAGGYLRCRGSHPVWMMKSADCADRLDRVKHVIDRSIVGGGLHGTHRRLPTSPGATEAREMSSGLAQVDSPVSRVIEPKLMPPRVHPGMLRRARLLEMLGDEASFTVLNAAVGYGKTTLVRSWCVERPEAVIWVTLDSADGDPVRLWTHLATAVERLGEGFGRRALSCLGVRGASVESAVDELMNGLVAYGRRVTIVLDDMHAVRSEASVRSIAQAIERLPANARLVASTRSDPAIGLGRLRARRGLTEVRARELAFTVEEARELVVREGIGLSTQSVELLVDRTEGWPAGLYLAALWLRDLRDPNGRVREFAGSARQVGEYLADEVLTALAPEIKDFLVRTSVLGRFTPELCDAVLGREDSVAVLADLAHSNMFLVALDNRGEWYRYHHLFGEVLQLELGRDAARELRRRAAAWCRAHGLVEEAIEYAAAAGDAELVAELLIERHLEFIWGGRLRQFLDWVRWLPAELLVRASGAAGSGCGGRRAALCPGGRGSAASRRSRSALGGSGRSFGCRISRRASKPPVRR